MPEDDSGGSTDLTDVFLQAMATPVFRPLAVWMTSVAGVIMGLLIYSTSDEVSGISMDELWLIGLGPPVSFVGGLREGMEGWLWVNDEAYAEHRKNLQPWEYSAVRVWTLRVLLPCAALLWLRAAVRVCAGRRIRSSLCHLFFASVLITSGRLEHLWWVGVLLSTGMVWMYWNMKIFSRIRAEEQEFERDGI